MFAGVLWAVRHALDRKIRQPWRKREWAKKRTPFVHRGADGFLFKLRPPEYIDSHIYIDGIFERRFLDMIKHYFKSRPNGVALDVGANIGNHAIFLSNVFYRIHCFDPNPLVTARLKENLALNKITNVIVHEFGLSNRTTTLSFVTNVHGNLGGSHFVDQPTAESIELPVVLGDEYIEKFGLDRIDLLKIDVENHEQQVFAGLVRTIMRFRPIIAFEYHGDQVPPETFTAVAASMIGYVFAEARYPTPNAPMLEKLKWHAGRRGWPNLARFDVPERRSYETILAFPDETTYETFTKVE